MRTSQRKIRTSTASARILQQNRNCRCALWVRRQFHFAGPVAGVSSQGRKKPQRATVAVFCGPDTRQRLLPLLPFGPDGVGSAAAVRLGKTLTRKEGRLSMAVLAFRLRSTVAQQGRGVAHDGFHLRIREAGKALQALALFHWVVQRPICAKENTFSWKCPKKFFGKQWRCKGRCA